MNFLVIGETCSDRFCYGESKRLCPEAPVPIFVPHRSVDSLGMASNVYENMQAIELDVHKGLPYQNTIRLFTNEAEGHKIRYIDESSNQMFLRVDTDTYTHCGELPKYLEDYSAVVVSDYDKGFLKEEDLREIAMRSKLSFLDTKKGYNSEWANLFDYIKINEKEHNENGWGHRGDDNLIVTKSSKGCWFNQKDYKIQKPAEVRDVSGAGDTFLAALAYGYTTTKHIETAIIFAQDCCQKVICKKGVATI